MTTFADLGVPTPLVRALTDRSITEPFPIQTAAIPDLLAGHDVLGKAPTGSGKTLAFGLPLMTRVERAEPRRPRALVLAPTRELAEQISKELIPLGRAAKRWVLAVYGGVGYDFQRKQLNRGTDVLVATPGRLNDLVEQRALTLEDVDIVVIDEADRMADMGFMPQVRRLVDLTSDRRQTVLFSATLDGEVAELTRRYQTDPRTHEIAGEDHAQDANHYFWRIDRNERVTTAAEVIGTSTPSIVFTRTRRGADRVASQLERSGVAAASIHGGRSQSQRRRALDAFSKGRVKALVATDVAARGIHVDGVASVIHFDLPADAKDYLHRSGRTARAGAEGLVVSFVGSEDVGDARRLQRSVGLTSQMQDPNADWQNGESAGRIGEAPVESPGKGRGSRPNGGNRRRGSAQNRSSRNRSTTHRKGQGPNTRNQRNRSRNTGSR